MRYRIVPFWRGLDIITDEYEFVSKVSFFGKDIFYIHKKVNNLIE